MENALGAGLIDGLGDGVGDGGIAAGHLPLAAHGARVTSESDRRSYALALTSAGAALLDRVTPQVRAHERHIAARLSAREKVLLIDLLERVAGTAGRP